MRLAITLAASLFAGCASADKLNISYVNAAPAPYGSNFNILTDAMAQDYSGTSFQRYILMSLGISDPPACPAGNCQPNPVYWGPDQPIVLTGDWSTAAADPTALATIQTLGSKGIELFISMSHANSLGYFSSLKDDPTAPANATDCSLGGASEGTVNCGIWYLQRFMELYGFAGVDFDLESGMQGFEVIAKGLGDNAAFSSGTLKVSFAPFVDSAGGTAANGNFSDIYTLNGACALQNAGITDYLAGRQYYAGGSLYVGDDISAFVSHVSSVLTQAKTFVCQTDSSGAPEYLKLTEDMYVLGMSPYSVTGFPGRGGPPNCQYYYDEKLFDCAEGVKAALKAHPNLAGAFLWTIGLTDWDYYSCYMGNAVHGTSNDCGTAQPVPGDPPKQ